MLAIQELHVAYGQSEVLHGLNVSVVRRNQIVATAMAATAWARPTSEHAARGRAGPGEQGWRRGSAV